MHPFFIADTLPGKYSAILGIDFAKKHGLSYCSITNSTYFEKPEKLLSAAVLSKDAYLPARSSTKVKLKMPFDDLQTMMVSIRGCRQVLPSEYLLKPKEGYSICYLTNSSFNPQKIPKGTMVGHCEKVDPSELHPFDLEATTPKSNSAVVPPRPKLTRERRKKIEELASLDHLSAKDKQKLLDLLFKHHKCLSLSEFDLGCCRIGSHNIPTIPGAPPAYSKQFPLGYEQEMEVRRQILEWIKLGIVTETESSFNSSLFCIKKKLPPQKPGCPPPKQGFRVVADCRQLNEQTIESRFRLPLISEAFDRVAAEQPSYFTGFDLRSGFTQLSIDPSSQHKTAFTDLRTGIQYMFTRTLQGLRNAPSSFHRVVVRIFKKLLAKGCCQVYLDDILCYNKTLDEHLSTVDEALTLIEESGMLINVEKCEFAVSKITYLGFEMDKFGYRPDSRKMKCITELKAPETLRGIRGVLGFCNFYRHLLAKYSQLVQPITYLTTKESKYHGGPMPPQALQAFKKLKEIFTSRPFLAFPDYNLDFHIYCDASLGTLENPRSGGLAGVCVQYPDNDTSKPPRPIGFCSRSLKIHERQYTTSMVETLSIIFSIEYFDKYLRKKFYVHSDHKGLSICKTIHRRTVERFREILANYDFEIIYEKGETMVADFPSRHCGDNKEVDTITRNELEKGLENIGKEKLHVQNESEKILENFECRSEKMQLQKVQTSNCKRVTDKNSHQDVWLGQRVQHAHHASANSVEISTAVSQSECTSHKEKVTAACSDIAVDWPIRDKSIRASVDQPGSHAPCSAKFSNNVNQPNSCKSSGPVIDKSELMLKKKSVEVAALKTVGEFNLNLQYEPEENINLIINQQKEDPFIQQLRIFIEEKILPKARYRNIIKRFGPNAFIDKRGLVMIRLKRQGFVTRDLLVLPATRQGEYIAKSHGSQVGGHLKVDKTANRLLEYVWWAGLWADCAFFISECPICRRMKAKEKASNTYLKPLPQCTFPFQTVSLDLKGPYKNQNGGKSFIFVAVDHFTKYAIFKSIPNKQTDTVAKCFYEHFICQFSAPMIVLTDQGQEWVSTLFKELCKLMQIDKIQTAAYRPQTNSTAEVVNKHIGKYLQALILEKGGDWERYLPSCQHVYNMSVHSALKASPFSILFGLRAPNSVINAAGFDSTPLYGENIQQDLARRLQFARNLAVKNNMKFREQYKEKFDKKVIPHKFSRGHLVYLHRPELVKLKGVQSPWFGPYLILEIFPNNALIQDLGSKRTRFVNLNRLRMYDISPEEWKKFKLTKPVDDNSTSLRQAQGLTEQKKEEAPEFAEFELGEDIVCLNPEAANSAKPRVLKLEPSYDQASSLGSPSQQHEGNNSFLESVGDTISDTFGFSDTFSEQAQAQVSQDVSPKLDAEKMNSGKGNSGGIRVVSLPSENSGQITRRTAKRAQVDIPPVFGNEFWNLNQSKPEKRKKK